MNKSFLFFFSLACYLLCLVYADRLFFKRNHHFSLRYLYSALPDTKPWDPSSCSVLSEEEVEKVFAQPFFYLSKGHQSFVFESEDKQYIIKFYKFPSHLGQFSWLSHVLTRGTAKRQQIEKYNIQKLKDTLSSYSLAFKELQEESALLLVHLHKTRGFAKKITLVDSSKSVYEVPLDATHFIVQKKGELIFSVLQNHVELEEIAEAKHMIDQICLFISHLCQKGIKDDDAILEKNYGWLGGKAFLLDVGRLSVDPSVKDPVVAKQFLLQTTGALKDWLMLYCPSLIPYYQSQIEKIESPISLPSSI